MHRSLAPPDPTEVAHDVSPELARIILRCLEKDPRGALGQRRRAAAGARGPAARRQGGGSHGRGGHPHGRRPGGPARRLRQHLRQRPRRRPAHPSADELIPLVYDELRRLARGFLSRERPNHTLQPTALVHEAYMRLAKQQAVDWAGRTHFFAVGANVMRRLLIDHARTRGRLKRGGDLRKVTLQEAHHPGRRPRPRLRRAAVARHGARRAGGDQRAPGGDRRAALLWRTDGGGGRRAPRHLETDRRGRLDRGQNLAATASGGVAARPAIPSSNHAEPRGHNPAGACRRQSARSAQRRAQVEPADSPAARPHRLVARASRGALFCCSARSCRRPVSWPRRRSSHSSSASPTPAPAVWDLAAPSSPWRTTLRPRSPIRPVSSSW